MARVLTYTTITCAHCGKQHQRNAANIARFLRKNPDYKSFCDGYCAGQWKVAQRVEKNVTFKCSLCGAVRTIEEKVYKTRVKASGGFVYCSSSCSSRGGRLRAMAQMEKAKKDGVMECRRCGRERPLSEFRLKEGSAGLPWPYLRVCIDCPPGKRYADASRSAPLHRINVAYRRDSGLGADEVLDISKCDHTPVEGPCLRAPDTRVLKRADAAEYKWSCRVCGLSYKDYEAAKDCCIPKGTMRGGRFYPFDEKAASKQPTPVQRAWIAPAESQGA